MVFRKGSLNHVPAALSRLSYKEVAENDDNSDLDYISTLGEITDPWYARRMQDVTQTPWKLQNYKVKENRLYRHKRDQLLDPISGNEHNWRLVLPEGQRLQALQEVHNTPSSGNFGVAKTYQHLAIDYYWPGMYHDTEK